MLVTNVSLNRGHHATLAGLTQLRLVIRLGLAHPLGQMETQAGPTSWASGQAQLWRRLSLVAKSRLLLQTANRRRWRRRYRLARELTQANEAKKPAQEQARDAEEKALVAEDKIEQL
ncbi:hypothetical protein Salat_2543000 [Sesamum alatum]|uniref:Uncharacterized protein n=1 Tax=Sesamum alatum TaxID=300844 RepID=A0AAE1XSB6_9LAMI|nr:hypothetical protein Salat_2543000 [Sesamum alatum]